MEVAVNLLTLGGSEEGGDLGDSQQKVAEAMDVNGGGEGGGGRGEAGGQDEGVMDTESEEKEASKGSERDGGARKGRSLVRGRASSDEDLLSPFIPCLLAYLNRAISENVGKRGRGRENGRSLESEFVVLSR